MFYNFKSSFEFYLFSCFHKLNTYMVKISFNYRLEKKGFYFKMLGHWTTVVYFRIGLGLRHKGLPNSRWHTKLV